MLVIEKPVAMVSFEGIQSLASRAFAQMHGVEVRGSLAFSPSADVPVAVLVNGDWAKDNYEYLGGLDPRFSISKALGTCAAGSVALLRMQINKVADTLFIRGRECLPPY